MAGSFYVETVPSGYNYKLISNYRNINDFVLFQTVHRQTHAQCIEILDDNL